ncbi:MAG: FG-GAP repeat protein [Pirellulaceae bacterium]
MPCLTAAGLTIGSLANPLEAVTVGGSLSLADQIMSITANTININAAVNTSGGDVSLAATAGVTLNAGVVTSGGAVTVNADSDGDGNGTLNVPAAVVGGWVQRGAEIDGEAALNSSGYSVAMSNDGNVLVVGAPHNSDSGNFAGQARVYSWSGSAWMRRGADIDGEATGDLSGSAVAMSSDGSILAVGAPLNDGNGNNAGQARVYHWNGSAWMQRGTDLDGEAADDRFGESVALNGAGNTIIVGAWNNGGTGPNAGHARVYDWDGAAWVQRGTDIDGEAANDQSGYSVAISNDGDTVAVGANGNDGNGTSAGQTRVYDWNGTAWVLRGLDIEGEAAFDNSGFSIALSGDGNSVAVGGHLNDGNGTSAGHGRVYNWDGLSWIQQGADIDGEATGDEFGRAVTLSSDGSTLVVGAYRNDGNGTDAGHVRVFVWSGSAWIQQGADIDGEAAGDEFGRAVAVNGNGKSLVIGAYRNDGIGSDAGHARIYDWIDSTAGGSISTSGGSVSITAADVNLEGNIDPAAGSISFLPTSGRTVDLGASGGTGQFVLTDTELDLVTTTNKITVGSATTGSVIFTGPLSMTNSNTLEVVTSDGITQEPVGPAISGATLILKGDLAPALASTGTFNVNGSVSFDATASYEVNWNGVLLDQLVVAGDSRTITLGGAELVVTLDMIPAARSREVVTIIDSTGIGSSVSGTFKVGGVTLNDGDTFMVGSTVLSINYNLPDGDVTLTEASNIGPDAIDDVSGEVTLGEDDFGINRHHRRDPANDSIPDGWRYILDHRNHRWCLDGHDEHTRLDHIGQRCILSLDASVIRNARPERTIRITWRIGDMTSHRRSVTRSVSTSGENATATVSISITGAQRFPGCRRRSRCRIRNE